MIETLEIEAKQKSRIRLVYQITFLSLLYLNIKVNINYISTVRKSSLGVLLAPAFQREDLMRGMKEGERVDQGWGYFRRKGRRDRRGECYFKIKESE